MKYKYSQHGYHPKNVSFEVEALLLDENKVKMLGNIALQNTIIGNNWGYLREMALGFNPLTDQIITCKYVEKQHKYILNYEHHEKTKKIAKQSSLSRKLSRNLLKKILIAFSAVIQNMLLKHIILKHSLFSSKENKVQSSYLENKSINQVITNKAEINIKYTIHPHVDALLYERAHSSHERFR